MALGKRVRKRRLALGLTQAELGKKAGLTKQYVSQLEADRNQPSLEAAVRIAKGLGCSVSDLTGERQPTAAAG